MKIIFCMKGVGLDEASGIQNIQVFSKSVMPLPPNDTDIRGFTVYSKKHYGVGNK